MTSPHGKLHLKLNYILMGIFKYSTHLQRFDANLIEVSALFGSIKCFKYLMMNEYYINEDTCRFAVSGGNIEIIHLCEQRGLQFEDCLFFTSLYHRFELFEWLNTHFNYKKTTLLFKFLRIKC